MEYQYNICKFQTPRWLSLKYAAGLAMDASGGM